MNIALIAQDAKKELMGDFCTAYKGILGRHKICATGSTGKIVQEYTGLDIAKLLSGMHGGIQQISARIACDEVDILFFFMDPMAATDSPRDSSTENNLLRLCDMHNIPFATNLASAEMLILSLERGDLEWREIIKTNN